MTAAAIATRITQMRHRSRHTHFSSLIAACGRERQRMIVGVPKEVKDRENRVGMTPAGVAELVHHEVQVLVERGAGEGSGYADAEYKKAGAKIVPTAADAWAAEMVVKVKEPTH